MHHSETLTIYLQAVRHCYVRICYGWLAGWLPGLENLCKPANQPKWLQLRRLLNSWDDCLVDWLVG